MLIRVLCFSELQQTETLMSESGNLQMKTLLGAQSGMMGAQSSIDQWPYRRPVSRSGPGRDSPR